MQVDRSHCNGRHCCKMRVGMRCVAMADGRSVLQGRWVALQWWMGCCNGGQVVAMVDELLQGAGRHMGEVLQ